jgi:hypothetical protein
MESVFTISGPPADGVQLLDYDAYPGGYLGAVSAHDQMCAQQVKVPFIAGALSTAAGVPAGLFGIYKTLRSGNRALGVVSLLGAVLLFGAGRVLLASSAKSFQACQKGG